MFHPPIRAAWRSAGALAAGLALWLLAGPAALATPNGEGAHGYAAREICPALIEQAEQARGIPRHLLLAISIAESGRGDRATGERFPWPWTVMAEGQGRYFSTKSEALAHIRALQKRGVRNIDVGCMQVNLQYHGGNFDSLEDALDPVNNVAYATAFLVDLRQDLHSWTKAVKHYHSATEARHIPYRAKVYDIWDDLRSADRGKPLVASAPKIKGVTINPNVRPSRPKVDAATKELDAERALEAASTEASEDGTPEPVAPTGMVVAGGSLGAWPPRGVSQQRQAEALARLRALAPR